MQMLMNNNGTVPLRCNVAYRDWRHGIDKYRSYGLKAESVYMNVRTLYTLIDYFRKHSYWGLHNPYIMPDQHVYVEGIEILIDNSMEDETMRVVW